MRHLVLAGLFIGISAPAFADSSQGIITAFDRVSKVLVLKDKTVWTLPGDLLVPADLAAGDKVKLQFQSRGDEGITRINSLERVSQ